MSITNPFESCFGHQLRRCSAMMSSDLVRATRAVGLKSAEAATLFMIATNPGQSQITTARLLDVRPANLVPHIATLVKLGLVARAPGRGKSWVVTPTAKGVKKAAKIGALISTHEARYQQRLEPAEREELIRLLVKLRGDDPPA